MVLKIHRSNKRGVYFRLYYKSGTDNVALGSIPIWKGSWLDREGKDVSCDLRPGTSAKRLPSLTVVFAGPKILSPGHSVGKLQSPSVHQPSVLEE